MTRVIFTNINNQIFKNLSVIGLINYYDINNPETNIYKGKNLLQLCIEGLSEKACYGDYNILIKSPQENKELYWDKFWTRAEITLSDEGIQILENSSIKNYTYDT